MKILSELSEQPPPAIHWKYHKYLDRDLLALPRLCEVWNGILSRRDIFKLALPELSKGKSPGKVFCHAEEMVAVVPW